MGEFVPCLYDINRALEGNYHEHLSEKLRLSKKQCFLRIREANEVHIDTSATDPINVKNIDDDAEWRNYCDFENPLIPNAFSKIKTACNERWG